jgi:hypothetical protein
MYAKLENGFLRSAPKTITLDGKTINNPLPEELEQLGYKPVMYTDMPIEVTEGKHWESSWEEEENAIRQVWTLVDNPVYPEPDLSAEEALNIIMGGGTVTREQVEQLRKLLENQTANMTDEQILEYPDFVEKWQSGKEYVVGKRLEYNGTIYKVLQAHTSQETWTPPDAPSLFAKVLIPDSSTVPEWEQPDSTNPYAKGDKVTHNGKTWISTADGNVWEPGVYGWEEV